MNLISAIGSYLTYNNKIDILATLITHPVVPLAIGMGLGQSIIPRRLLIAGVLLSVLPDLDVLMPYLGVPWGSVYAHRGLSHSISFAVLVSLLMLFVLQSNRMVTFVFSLTVVLSHTMLDALTWGGQGVALYWPFDAQRVQFDSRPIPASPMSITGFMRWGGYVLRNELKVIWAPLIAGASVSWAIRKWTLPKLYKCLA